MQDMILFSTKILELLSEFLWTEPIKYLFGLVCLCFICKAINNLIAR